MATITNVSDINCIDYFAGSNNKKTDDRLLLGAILEDLDEFNDILAANGKEEYSLHIVYEDKHTEWPAERTDPCPDYYGHFILAYDNYPEEMVADVMTLDELDNALFLIVDFFTKIFCVK